MINQVVSYPRLLIKVLNLFLRRVFRANSHPRAKFFLIGISLSFVLGMAYVGYEMNIEPLGFERLWITSLFILAVVHYFFHKINAPVQLLHLSLTKRVIARLILGEAFINVIGLAYLSFFSGVLARNSWGIMEVSWILGGLAICIALNMFVKALNFLAVKYIYFLSIFIGIYVIYSQEPLLLTITHNSSIQPIILFFLMMITLSGVSYFITHKLDEWIKNESHTRDYLTLEHIGNPLFTREFYLIQRNKRANQFILLNGIGIFIIGLVILVFEEFADYLFMELLIIVYILGAFLFSSWQMIWAWESSHFSIFFLSAKDISSYVYEKYRFAVFITILLSATTLILSLFIDVRYFNLILIGFLCNITINAFLLMVMGRNNNTYIELNQSTFFNYQGIKSSQFSFYNIMILEVLLIYLIIKFVPYGEMITIVLLSLLLLGIHTAKQKVSSVLKKNKYKLLEGYAHKD